MLAMDLGEIAYRTYRVRRIPDYPVFGSGIGRMTGGRQVGDDR